MECPPNYFLLLLSKHSFLGTLCPDEMNQLNFRFDNCLIANEQTIAIVRVEQNRERLFKPAF